MARTAQMKFLSAAKNEFDPNHVLNPGLGIAS